MAVSLGNIISNPVGSLLNSAVNTGGTINNVLANPTGYVKAGVNNLNSFGKNLSGQVLDDSTTTPNSIYGSGGSYAGSAGTGSSADIAAYTDQINQLNQLLGNTDAIQNNGVNSINTGYDNSVNQLTGQHDTNVKQLTTQKDNTVTNYGKNITAINNNARNGYNSLQQLLGGTGSAGDILAPLAVSSQANSQRGASADTFAQNLKAVQDALDGADQNFMNQKKTLEGQKNDQLQKLLSSIDQQKIAYQQQLGAAQNQLNVAKGGSYQTPTANNNAIADLIAQQNNLSSLYAQPQFTVQDYTAPSANLGDYTAQAAQLSGLNNQPDTTADDTSTALAALLKQNQATNGYSF